MYCEVTNDIRVEVEPNYVPDQSKPKSHFFFFSYRVKITNLGIKTTQLVSRHWIVTDGNGVVHEVRGSGVVGYEPILAPGDTFEYSSYCPLPTPTGNMRGTFQMIDQHRKQFPVKIPLFFLRDLASFH
jgi:ApaG protein